MFSNNLNRHAQNLTEADTVPASHETCYHHVPSLLQSVSSCHLPARAKRFQSSVISPWSSENAKGAFARDLVVHGPMS